MWVKVINEIEKQIVNLTPHPIVILVEDGTEIEIPPSGVQLRAKEEAKEIGAITLGKHQERQIRVFQVSFGAPEPHWSELPNWDDESAIYIVSAVAAQAIRAHWPDDVRRRFYLTYLAERDAQGRIRGAKALASI